jgi:hypothetical protein
MMVANFVGSATEAGVGEEERVRRGLYSRGGLCEAHVGKKCGEGGAHETVAELVPRLNILTGMGGQWEQDGPVARFVRIHGHRRFGGLGKWHLKVVSLAFFADWTGPILRTQGLISLCPRQSQ